MTRAARTLGRRRHRPLWEELLYRLPMTVVEIRVFSHCHGSPAFPICPRCGLTIEREYMAFCSRCGQKLDWGRYLDAKIIDVELNDEHTP